jgi:hypothetical protein
MRRFFTLLFLLCIAFLQTQAQNLIVFNLDGVATTDAPVSSTTNEPGVLPSSLSRGSGITAVNGTSIFNSNGFASGTNLAVNTANNDYYEFTVSPSNGAEITISSITFSGIRTGGQGSNNGGPHVFCFKI